MPSADLKRPIACWSKVKENAGMIKDIDRILLDMTNNTPGVLPVIVPPAKSLAQCGLDNLAFSGKQTIALTKVPGSAAIRDVAKNVAVTDIDDKKGWIQSLMDNAPDLATKIAICNASGFRLKINGKFFKPPFEAKQGSSGQAVLVQISGGLNSFYEWRMSTSLSPPRVYTVLPSNLVANTVVNALTIGNNYFFSGRKTTRTKKKEVTTDWTGDILFTPK